VVDFAGVALISRFVLLRRGRARFVLASFVTKADVVARVLAMAFASWFRLASFRTGAAMGADDTTNTNLDSIIEQAKVQARIMHGMSKDQALDHVRDVMGSARVVFGVWHHVDDTFEIMPIKGEHLLQNDNDPPGGLPYDAIPCTDYKHALSIQKLLGDGAPTLN
jgi:hypothetical protein